MLMEPILFFPLSVVRENKFFNVVVTLLDEKGKIYVEKVGS